MALLNASLASSVKSIFIFDLDMSHVVKSASMCERCVNNRL